MKPLLARFRQAYEDRSLPLGRLCAQLGLSANTLTYASLLCSILAGYLVAQRFFLASVGVVGLVALTDVLDGATARASGTTSNYGTVLDHVVDRYAEFFILGGILLSGAVRQEWVLFALFGMVMASYVRARAESTHPQQSCNVGLVGRQEKVGLLVLGLVLQALLPHSSLLQWATIAVGVLSHATTLQRLAYTKHMGTAVPTSDLQQRPDV